MNTKQIMRAVFAIIGFQVAVSAAGIFVGKAWFIFAFPISMIAVIALMAVAVFGDIEKH